MIYVNY